MSADDARPPAHARPPLAFVSPCPPFVALSVTMSLRSNAMIGSSRCETEVPPDLLFDAGGGQLHLPFPREVMIAAASSSRIPRPPSAAALGGRDAACAAIRRFGRMGRRKIAGISARRSGSTSGGTDEEMKPTEGNRRKRWAPRQGLEADAQQNRHRLPGSRQGHGQAAQIGNVATMSFWGSGCFPGSPMTVPTLMARSLPRAPAGDAGYVFPSFLRSFARVSL
jgi:hypothetical protein